MRVSVPLLEYTLYGGDSSVKHPLYHRYRRPMTIWTVPTVGFTVPITVEKGKRLVGNPLYHRIIS